MFEILNTYTYVYIICTYVKIKAQYVIQYLSYKYNTYARLNRCSTINANYFYSNKKITIESQY